MLEVALTETTRLLDVPKINSKINVRVRRTIYYISSVQSMLACAKITSRPARRLDVEHASLHAETKLAAVSRCPSELFGGASMN